MDKKPIKNILNQFKLVRKMKIHRYLRIIVLLLFISVLVSFIAHVPGTYKIEIPEVEDRLLDSIQSK